MTTLPRLTLPELRRAAIRTFRQGRGSRPDVLLIEHHGTHAVLKDHGACDPWFGRILGPLLAWRECRGLDRLGDLRGVPRVLARPDRRSLLLEYLPAEPILRAGDDVDWAQFFPRLERLIDAVHERGVAHCDLRSPNNTLITASGEPVIVDFVACVRRGRRWNRPWAWVFDSFCAADRAAVAKLKRHVAPGLLNADERRQLGQQGGLERAARRVGGTVRSLSRRWFTRGDV